MKKVFITLLFIVQYLLFNVQYAVAQCSICTKTAQQLGEGPAKALNVGILYLMFAPLAIIGIVGYRWWKKERALLANEKEEE
jgi:hypothetical protein